MSRAPEARKALEDFLKDASDLREALKGAEAAVTNGANDAKRAAAQHIQQLVADVAKLQKEAEVAKAQREADAATLQSKVVTEAKAAAFAASKKAEEDKKKEAEQEKVLAQLRESKRALESERDALRQKLSDLRKTAAGAAKLQDSLKTLQQQLTDATVKLKRDAEELVAARKKLQNDAVEIAALKKAVAASADAQKKEAEV